MRSVLAFEIAANRFLFLGFVGAATLIVTLLAAAVH